MLADFYALMGVSPTATQEEIRQAYQTLTIQLQPDARPGSAAAERLRLLDEAYRVLMTSALRAGYDAQWRQAITKAPPPVASVLPGTATIPFARGARGDASASPLRLSVTPASAISAPLKEPERYYALAELSPAGQPIASPAAPLNLAVMIARSMTLRDQALMETRRALDALGALLRPEDRLTLVTFDEQASVALDGESVAGRRDVGQALEPMAPRGPARLSSALGLALERSAAHITPTGVSAFALIMNSAPADEERAGTLDLAERARQLGVQIVALGVGPDWDRDLFDQFASVTGGVCAFVDDPSRLTRILTWLVERLRATLASRLRLTLEPAPGVSVLRAARIAPELSYAFEGPHTPGAPVGVELGTLAGGAEACGGVALWETLLEPSTLSVSVNGSLELGTIHSSYWAPQVDGGRVIRDSAPLRAPQASGATPPALAPDARLALELLTAYRLQTLAERLASDDVEEACAALDTAALRLASAGAATLAEETRQASVALAHGLADAGVTISRVRYSVRNQSLFHHLRHMRG